VPFAGEVTTRPSGKEAPHPDACTLQSTLPARRGRKKGRAEDLNCNKRRSGGGKGYATIANSLGGGEKTFSHTSLTQEEKTASLVDTLPANA